jgi:hypothetical protein
MCSKIKDRFILTTTLVLLSFHPANALTGPCENCHTMHSSQNGIEEAPEYFLQNITCWDCHGRGISENIDPVNGTPQVRHLHIADLAGGNFAYITGDKQGITGNNMTRGHNMKFIDETDTNFSGGAYPPGDQYGNVDAGLTNSTFTCAGKFGCHGDRTIEDEYAAVNGAHHYNDRALKFGSIDMNSQALTGGTLGEQVGSSYRFLKGVKGGEDPDWHATVDLTDHNEYFGTSTAGQGSRTAPAGGTISGFCAECHGYFHGAGAIGSDTSSAIWIRHPTDISLPGGESEYAGYTTYSIDVPVARTEIPQSPKGTVDPGGMIDDIVMCLSCHVAHASPYADLLRFNYDDMIAGDSSKQGGCFTCHTTKNR